MVLVVHHEIFRPPTGLSAFPDGGRSRTTLHELVVYGADAATGKLELWQRGRLDDDLWTAFDMTIVGAAPDTVYAALSGCHADVDECWGPGRERKLIRFTSDGQRAAVESVPPRHRTEGQTAAPEESEGMYLRVSPIQRDIIAVRLAYGSTAVPLFVIRPTGELAPIQAGIR